MYLSPCPVRNQIFVASNQSATMNNLPPIKTIYYNVNQSDSSFQNSILSGENKTGINFLQQVPSMLQSNSPMSLNISISQSIQPVLVLNNFSTQNSINISLNLVPPGSAISRHSYEPTHRCTTCEHEHACDISNIRQAIDPPVKKVHEPIIINTAKAMGRINRRMMNGPYFHPSRNVLIPQNEILHRTMADPNLNFTDIVNQVAKEIEQEQEKAIITGKFSLQKEHQSGPLGPSSRSPQEQFLNSNATLLTTPDVTIICNEQLSSISTPIIRDSKLVDNSLGYKKICASSRKSRKNVVAAKPRPNPVTPNLKMSNGNTLESLKVFFSKLWYFG